MPDAYLTVIPWKQKSNGVGLKALPATISSTAVMAVPDTNALPSPSQHCVLSCENRRMASGGRHQGPGSVWRNLRRSWLRVRPAKFRWHCEWTP
jgi:hypothetical protein